MIPFLDIRAQYQAIRSELDAAVLDVLGSGEYVLGSRVAAFEKEFAAYCGTKHAIAVNSGTSALHLALLAAGVGPGDEVITVPATFVATVAAICYANATPVFVDIDEKTWTMDPALIERAITPRTKAIMPVHLHGRLADMAAILDIARRNGLAVIEDAAQAHGAERDGRCAGAFGNIGCFSFYPGKNLGACGEGGAVVTDRSDLADHIRKLRDWGQAGKYNHEIPGFNYRMDGVQGAVLGVKLRYLPDWVGRRRAVAAQYDDMLSNAGIATPRAAVALEHAYHVYAIRVADRSSLQHALTAAGVSTGIHYPHPVHVQPAYKSLGYGIGDFPVSERLADETLSLPIFPEMTSQQVETVCGAVINALQPSSPARLPARPLIDSLTNGS
jgi:dTDP-4-amino-4,6-dideoxygalactose transaminase